jgi:hypothetical protein
MEEKKSKRKICYWTNHDRCEKNGMSTLYVSTRKELANLRTMLIWNLLHITSKPGKQPTLDATPQLLTRPICTACCTAIILLI